MPKKKTRGKAELTLSELEKAAEDSIERGASTMYVDQDIVIALVREVREHREKCAASKGSTT